MFSLPKFHVLFLVSFVLASMLQLLPLTLACSSRSLPKPRPSSVAAPTSTNTPVTTTQRSTTTTTTSTTTTTTTTTTPRPNITFPTFKCPANYDAWYCLNEATCFTVKIGDSIMYNCECAIGFMGPRCEYKELDGSYQPKRPRPILEKASIASGATCILLFLLFVCLTLYLRYEQRTAKFINEHEYKTTSTSASYNNCRFCSDRYCCSADDFNDSKFLLANDNSAIKGPKGSLATGNGGGSGNGSWLRQHIEAFPMGLTVKRFNKA